MNVIVGGIDKAKIILTAHYDTPVKFIFPFSYTLSNGKFSFVISQLLMIVPILLICRVLSFFIEVITSNLVLARFLVIIINC